MIDIVRSVLQCKHCREVVRILYASDYDDDRRWEHDHPGRGAEKGGRVCRPLEPVEIGQQGLSLHVATRRESYRTLKRKERGS